MTQQHDNEKEETGFAYGLVTFLLFGLGVGFGMNTGVIASHIGNNIWWNLSTAALLYFVFHLLWKTLGYNIWLAFILGLPFGALAIMSPYVHDDFVKSEFYSDTGERAIHFLDSFRTANLTVRSRFYNDRLYINDKDYGPTGPESHTLNSGQHHIRVEKDGHDTWEKTINLEPNENISITAKLPKHTGQGSQVTLKEQPYENTNVFDLSENTTEKPDGKGTACAGIAKIGFSGSEVLVYEDNSPAPISGGNYHENTFSIRIDLFEYRTTLGPIEQMRKLRKDLIHWFVDEGFIPKGNFEYADVSGVMHIKCECSEKQSRQWANHTMLDEPVKVKLREPIEIRFSPFLNCTDDYGYARESVKQKILKRLDNPLPVHNWSPDLAK